MQGQSVLSLFLGEQLQHMVPESLKTTTKGYLLVNGAHASTASRMESVLALWQLRLQSHLDYYSF